MTLSRSTVLGSAGLVLLAAILYLAKTEAERVRDHVAELEQQLVEERKAVRILEAELVWRAGPQRLDAAARTAGLAPVEDDRVVALADLDTVLPLPGARQPASATAPPSAPASAGAPVRGPASTGGRSADVRLSAVPVPGGLIESPGLSETAETANLGALPAPSASASATRAPAPVAARQVSAP